MSSLAGVDVEQLRARAPRWRLTISDYHRMGDAGIFHEDDRVELIDGELFQMAPIGTRHAAVVTRLNTHFGALAGGRFLLSPQNPVQIPPHSEPQPDIVLLRPQPEGYFNAAPRPADVLLLIEVADSSLAWDRNIKISMYGRVGVAESWLVDIEHQTVIVFRDPGPEGYRSSVELREGAVSPCCFSNIAIQLDGLFR
jgi:Uma2 family endonuclease